MKNKKFFITTPIYYVNDAPHIGHAYTNDAADFIARFYRLSDYDVFFLTGTDEHGQKVEKAAKKANMHPQDFTNQVSEAFLKLNQSMNFSYDHFIRTTDQKHKQYVQEIWERLVKSGDIYLSKYCGWYSVRDEAFYAESELVDGKAPTGADVEWIEEPSYFFKLSKWQDKLLQLYQEYPDFIMPESRKNEIVSFVNGGLQDLSVSRTSFTWGIKVPGDEKHVIYVWLDALFNYLSAIGGEHSKYWPCDIHIVGKDILRFHTVYWPAFLMAAGIPVPKGVFAHGWWTNEGQKISKSLGNTIDPIKLSDEFGVDYVRYFMLREITFGNDGNYSRSSLIARVNSELANNIGNLAQRVISFTCNNCNATVPNPGFFSEIDGNLLNAAYNLIEKMTILIKSYNLSEALGLIVRLGNHANEYISSNPFWEYKRNNTDRMYTVIYVLLEVLRIIGIALQAITPNYAKAMLTQLGIEQAPQFSSIIDAKLIPGSCIGPAVPIFNKL